MVKININSDIIEDINLVVFDKDGTLIELYIYWFQMVSLRTKLIGERLKLNKEQQDDLLYEMGVDYKNKRLRPNGPVGLKKREVVLQAAVNYLNRIGYKDSYDLCFKIFTEVDQISSGNLQPFVKPIKGALKLINDLVAAKCKIAIATTDKTSRAILAMDFLEIGEKIDLVIGADKVNKPKPDPEIIYLILESLKVNKLNAVMIGDAISDVQLGINAGLKASIGLLTGLSVEDELKRLTMYVARSVAEISVK